VGQYLGDGVQEPRMVERALEEALDRMQPGWRMHVVERRFLPRMVAASALATADQAGLAGRPGAEVPEVPGLYLAGDWVGADGWRVDASLASGRHAAQLAARRVGRRAAAAA